MRPYASQDPSVLSKSRMSDGNFPISHVNGSILVSPLVKPWLGRIVLGPWPLFPHHIHNRFCHHASQLRYEPIEPCFPTWMISYIRLTISSLPTACSNPPLAFFLWIVFNFIVAPFFKRISGSVDCSTEGATVQFSTKNSITSTKHPRREHGRISAKVYLGTGSRIQQDQGISGLMEERIIENSISNTTDTTPQMP